MIYKLRIVFVMLLLLAVTAIVACDYEAVGTNIADDINSSGENQLEPGQTQSAQSTTQSERTRLSFGVLHSDDLIGLQIVIDDFNRSSVTHYVHVIDYSALAPNEDLNSAINLLTMDILTGRAPDMLLLNRLPFTHYIQRGLLVDLYPFIDSDPEFGRDMLISTVLMATETDGSLYRIAPNFMIRTIGGSQDILGSYPGWNLSEFMAVLENNPGADLPMGPNTSIWYFIGLLLDNLDEFIDLSSGEAFFDSGDFAKLLEFAKRYVSGDYWDADFFMRRELITSGRQIMEPFVLGNFVDVWESNAQFDGEVVFKGFPNSDRGGNRFVFPRTFAITTNADDKDGAWSFLRFLLIGDFQKLQSDFMFPVNRAIFQEQLDRALSRPLAHPWRELPPDSMFLQEDADRLIELIDNTTKASDSHSLQLEAIVIDSVWDFFNGRNTSDDIARITQSRVSTYLAEQMG